MVLSLELQTKCNWCGSEINRNSFNQIVFYCSKECRKLARSKKFRKKFCGSKRKDLKRIEIPNEKKSV